MENPVKMDDLGVPLILETSISIYHNDHPNLTNKLQRIIVGKNNINSQVFFLVTCLPPKKNKNKKHIGEIHLYEGFLKWCYPTTMGFPTKNAHFGVEIGGTTI